MPELPDTLEERLARTLHVAADLVPDEALAGDLIPDVRRRKSRRTRRRVQILLAAAAVIAVVAATSVAATRLTARPPVVNNPIQFREAGYISGVWPLAVTRIPARSADGLTYTPRLALDASHILVTAQSAARFPARFDVVDTESRRATVFAAIPRTEGLKKLSLLSVDADGTYVVWQTTSGADPGSEVREVWMARRSEGTARLVRTFRPEAEDMPDDRGFHILGDAVFWVRSEVASGRTAQHMYRMPLNGGPPARLPDHLTGFSSPLVSTPWPWAQVTSEPRQDTAPESLINLISGATIALHLPPDVINLRCDLHWCAGNTKTGTVIQHPDGTGFQAAPAQGGDVRMLLDRYVLVGEAPTSYVGSGAGVQYRLIDLRDGTMVHFGAHFDFALYPPSGMAYWSADDPGEQWVLNLKALG